MLEKEKEAVESTLEGAKAAVKGAVAKVESKAVALEDRIDAAVTAWLVEHIHGSPVSQNTEAYNHLYRSLDALKARLAADIKPAAPAAAEDKE